MDNTDKNANESKDLDRDIVIEAMKSLVDIQDSPMIGLFWYDNIEDEIYGVRAEFACDKEFCWSKTYGAYIKSTIQTHEKAWEKEAKKGKDARFFCEYINSLKGSVFEFEDRGFVVITGSWINEYPNAKELILYEFQLPREKTDFLIKI